MKIAVIGLGSLGKHHVRIISRMRDVALEAVVDTDYARARKFAAAFGCKAFSSHSDVIGCIDAAAVVVPTPFHFSVSRDLITNGIHCFIEKPICQSLEEASCLMELAQKHRSIIQVGHVERFNRALEEAERYIRNPRFIEIDRLGPYSPRTGHIGVVLDLMIHDLDLLLKMVHSPVRHIHAIGGSVFGIHEDIANARISFTNGCVANISASRITNRRIRKIRIFQDDAYISIDMAKQKFKIFQKKYEKISTLKDIRIISPPINRDEPLKSELEHFVRCIRKGKKPRISGEEASNALALALRIIRLIEHTRAQ